MADQPRQADGAKIDQRYAEAAAEDAKDSALADHAHVRPQRKLHAAGNGMAFDGSNHRLRQPQPARAHRRQRTVATEFAALFAIAGGSRLQISTGAKRAVGAGEDRDGRLRIGVEGNKRLEQFARGGTVHSVASLRPVDRDDRHRAVALDQDCVGIGHFRTPVYRFAF